MAYFISEGVFRDAFILHDPSNHYTQIFDMIHSVRKHRQGFVSPQDEEANNNNNNNNEQYNHTDDIDANNNKTNTKEKKKRKKRIEDSNYRPKESHFLTLQSLARDGIIS